MKKLIFFLTVGLFYSASILAQSVDDEITLIQAEFGMGKRQLVDAVMDLPESVAPLFLDCLPRIRSRATAFKQRKTFDHQ